MWGQNVAGTESVGPGMLAEKKKADAAAINYFFLFSAW